LCRSDVSRDRGTRRIFIAVVADRSHELSPGRSDVLLDFLRSQVATALFVVTVLLTAEPYSKI